MAHRRILFRGSQRAWRRLVGHVEELVELLVGGQDLLLDDGLNGVHLLLLRGLLEEVEAGGLGGLEGEGDDGVADLYGGGVVELERKGVVGKDELSELGQVVSSWNRPFSYFMTAWHRDTEMWLTRMSESWPLPIMNWHFFAEGTSKCTMRELFFSNVSDCSNKNRPSSGMYTSTSLDFHPFDFYVYGYAFLQISHSNCFHT
jgi:hypothetical protein